MNFDWIKDRINLDEANSIKVAAVASAVPRTVIALMRSEGMEIPMVWGSFLATASFFLAFGMAITEAFAINYILKAIRNQRDQDSRKLWYFMVAVMVTFVGVVAPSIVASVSEQPMHEVLGPYGAWAWAVVIVLSTGTAVAGVGYASKGSTGRSTKPSTNSTRGQSHGQNGDTSETVHGQSTGPSTLSTRESMMDSIVDMYRDSPGARPVDIQRQLGLPKSTYYKYISKLVETGRLAQDGDGWHVVSQDKIK